MAKDNGTSSPFNGAGAAPGLPPSAEPMVSPEAVEFWVTGAQRAPARVRRPSARQPFGDFPAAPPPFRPSAPPPLRRVVPSEESAVASFRLLLWKVERRRPQTVVLRITCDHALETLQILSAQQVCTHRSCFWPWGAVPSALPTRTSTAPYSPTPLLSLLPPSPLPRDSSSCAPSHQRRNLPPSQRGNRLGSCHLKNIQPVHARLTNTHYPKGENWKSGSETWVFELVLQISVAF